MRILDLAGKDLSQILRDRKSALFLVIMPIGFTFFMGFALGGTGQPKDTRIALGWANQDPDGALSQQLHAMLSQSEDLRLLEVDPASSQDLVAQGKVSGVLLIPAGFSQDSLEGRRAQLNLIVDPASSTGQFLYQTLRGPVSELMSSVEIAQLDVVSIASQVPQDASAQREERLTALAAASQAWAKASGAAQVQMQVAVISPQGVPFGGNPYNQSSPGILVQFAIFGLITSAQILVQERKSRTLQRLMTTAMKAWEIIAGHMLAMFAIVFLQSALLIAFGQWLLKVNYLRQPLGTLLVSLALCLWVASLGLLIGVVARGDEQVILYSLLAMFLFSGLGGAWFPLEGAGRTFAAISKLIPSTWAMTGFQNLLIRGQGLDSVWRPALILSAYALAFFAVALWRFRKAAV